MGFAFLHLCAECIRSKGGDYRGEQLSTSSGQECLNWISVTLHFNLTAYTDVQSGSDAVFQLNKNSPQIDSKLSGAEISRVYLIKFPLSMLLVFLVGNLRALSTVYNCDFRLSNPSDLLTRRSTVT